METIHPGGVVGQSQESKEKMVAGVGWGVPSVPPDIVTFCCGAMSSPQILNLHLTSGHHGGVFAHEKLKHHSLFASFRICEVVGCRACGSPTILLPWL